MFRVSARDGGLGPGQEGALGFSKKENVPRMFRAPARDGGFGPGQEGALGFDRRLRFRVSTFKFRLLIRNRKRRVQGLIVAENGEKQPGPRSKVFGPSHWQEITVY
jgi:hypothetical protein